METIGLKRVGLSKLRLPGDFKNYLKENLTFALGDSIAKRGMYHEPLVRQSDWKVITGFRRVAAHFVKHWQTITVKLVECTDAEADIIKREEDFLRRHDPVEQQRISLELVDCYERELNERCADDPSILRALNNKKRQPRAIAIEQVAKMKGVRTVTVRDQMRQRKNKEKPKAPPPIVTWGIELAPKFMDELAVIYKRIRKAEWRAYEAVKEFTQMANSGIQLPPGKLEDMKAKASETAAAIRAETPAALCPACKGVDVLQQCCETCRHYGWVTAGQMEVIAPMWPALINTENRMVLVGRQLKPYTDFIPDEAPQQVEESPYY